MNDEKQNIQSWFPILKWDDLPNFGYAHTSLDYDQFVKDYLVTPELGQILDNLFVGLRGEHHLLNVRIMGKPGAGKTTFLYYIKKILEKNPDLVKGINFFIYISHIQRVIHNQQVDENLMMEEITQSWVEFYEANELENVAEDIKGLNISHKDKLRRFSKYYLTNKSKFSKIFIFVLDDIDNATNDQVRVAAQLLFCHLEVASVKKWLSLREATYNRYDAITKDYLQGFYPDRIIFPIIPLYDIIRFRIKSMNVDSQNPFSSELCELVQRIHFYHLRSALSTLKNILEDILPKGFAYDTDIRVIRNYIDKSSYITFFKHGVLPNIHDPKLRPLNMFPIPMDLLLLIKHISRTDEFLYGALNDVIDVKKSSVYKLKVTDLKMRIDDFKDALKFLADSELIEENGPKRSVLTSKGEVLSSVANRPLYVKACKEEIGDFADSDVYWKLVNSYVNYSKIVIDKLNWQVTV